jgi:hypothetical protein
MQRAELRLRVNMLSFGALGAIAKMSIFNLI